MIERYWFVKEFFEMSVDSLVVLALHLFEVRVPTSLYLLALIYFFNLVKLVCFFLSRSAGLFSKYGIRRLLYLLVKEVLNTSYICKKLLYSKDEPWQGCLEMLLQSYHPIVFSFCLQSYFCLSIESVAELSINLAVITVNREFGCKW